MPVSRYEIDFWSAEKVEEYNKFWIDFEKSIIQIYTEEEPTQWKKYMELYTAVYNHCNKIESNSNVSLKYGQERYTQCYKLYTSLEGFFIKHLINMVQRGMKLEGENFLSFYAHEWEKYTIGSQLLDCICSYLNRSWALPEKKERVNDVYEIYQLALMSWKIYSFHYLHEYVIGAALNLIEIGRNGEGINTTLISSVVDCYEQLDTLDTDQNNQVYENYFENRFIEATERYFTQEATNFLSSDYFFEEYMTNVDQRFQEESRVAQMLFRESTHQRLEETLIRVFISNHLDVFYTEFRNFLKTDDKISLKKIYRLVSKDPEGLTELAKKLESIIINEGFEALQKCQAYKLVDYPRAYVNAITEVFEKYKVLVQDCFHDYLGFNTVLHGACEKLFNNKALMKKLKNGRIESWSLLARYCDSVLSKDSNNQDESHELEDMLDRLAVLCRYVNNKDVFQSIYLKNLAKRLINNLSVSRDAEALMISKFKQIFSLEYTDKLQKMFLDFGNSQELNKRFREFDKDSKTRSNMDFDIHILCSRSWPFQQSQNFSLRSELLFYMIKFTSWYNCLFKNRKLNWLHNISTGEIYTNCFENNYTLQASTYQMAVLLHYNDSTLFTLEELRKSTQTELSFLVQIIETLLEAKLLETIDDSKNLLEPSSIIRLVKKYKNIKSRVDITVPLQVVQKKEEERAHKNIEEDRKYVIQAVIVRIMKAQKILNHKQLLAKVLNQLSPKFTPEVSNITTNIEILIEKEYLERLRGSHDIYRSPVSLS